MIIKSGPGKIILPDGTEIGVTFEIMNIEFSRCGGTTQAVLAYSSNDTAGGIASGRTYLYSDQIETVEFNGENPCRPSGA